MRTADIAIAAIVLFFVLLPKSSYRVDRYDRWDPAQRMRAYDLEEDLAKNPHDASAAVALASLYTQAVDHPDWALAVLSAFAERTDDWRVQVGLAQVHAVRFEWPQAVAAAQAARTACSPPACSDDVAARLAVYEQGLEAAERAGITKPGPAFDKAVERGTPQVAPPGSQ